MSRGSHALSRSTRVFFSFPEVTDPARHRDYNAWHQLDHRPENLALPGVLHGDRWVRSPECRAASAVDADPVLSAAQYVAMYWFAEPAGPAIEEWAELGQTTLEQGRRPELDWTRRRLNGFFRPLGGRVAPGVEISAEALPHRPHRGVVLEVLRAEEPSSVAAEAGFGVLRRAHLPAVLALPGVLGTWSFASRDVTLREGPGVGEVRRETDRGRLTVVLHWCEADPVEVAATLPAVVEEPGLRTVLRTPLRTITPGEWSWFD
ncbi:hypothetical protein [Nocardioides sp. zg-DK7169]|uniref:hypothetical protein n=1 Tax=Nocardioides sp. zg-DK7169 TaxID=2736600 RepID=UPI0015567ACE|nr:hypothetical protein [Nocardioides sp. zg-DK7169]NPC98697.1 hypothetical protein [Nocardioides sp. zg-DK7169]